MVKHRDSDMLIPFLLWENIFQPVDIGTIFTVPPGTGRIRTEAMNGENAGTQLVSLITRDRIDSLDETSHPRVVHNVE